MSADSGLPTFRSTEGLWNAYPYFKETKMTFQQAANPQFFYEKPQNFWFFYGHRFNIYKEAKPHSGYHSSLSLTNNYFVYTSNVDGHFLSAGCLPDRICECHGSILHNQCSECDLIFETTYQQVKIDPKTYEAIHLPKCPKCNTICRPNILMWNDFDWLSERTQNQKSNFAEWLTQNQDKDMVIIEAGAGEAVRAIRLTSEQHLFRDTNCKTTLIRINPDDQCSAIVTRQDPDCQIIDQDNIGFADRVEPKSLRSLVKLRMGAKDAFD